MILGKPYAEELEAFSHANTLTGKENAMKTYLDDLATVPDSLKESPLALSRVNVLSGYIPPSD